MEYCCISNRYFKLFISIHMKTPLITKYFKTFEKYYTDKERYVST